MAQSAVSIRCCEGAGLQGRVERQQDRQDQAGGGDEREEPRAGILGECESGNRLHVRLSAKEEAHLYRNEERKDQSHAGENC